MALDGAAMHAQVMSRVVGGCDSHLKASGAAVAAQARQQHPMRCSGLVCGVAWPLPQPQHSWANHGQCQLVGVSWLQISRSQVTACQGLQDAQPGPARGVYCSSGQYGTALLPCHHAYVQFEDSLVSVGPTQAHPEQVVGRVWRLQIARVGTS